MTPERAKIALKHALNETEPCYVDFDKDGNPNDPEKWTGAWVNSTTPEVAASLCEGCHVLELCGQFAILNEENNFIYGGMTPAQRKEEIARRRATQKANLRRTKSSNSTDTAA